MPTHNRPFPRDAYGDHRDNATESRMIVDREMAMTPTLEHCQALLQAILAEET